MTLPKQTDPKLWLVLLREIDLAGGQAKPSDIYPRLRKYFPEITDADLKLTTAAGKPQWINRVQWVRQDLIYTGCIDGQARGVWKITPKGQAWLHQHWQGADADYTAVPKPTKTSMQVDPSVEVPAKPPDKLPPSPPQPEPPAIIPLADPVEALCQRLLKAQRLSDHHEGFELALRDAFDALGFDAQHIGGPSDTDILLVTHIGTDSYRAIVDAKSTKSGKVPEAQINWSVLDQHRKHHGAHYAAVVGEDFSGGNLKRFAEDHKVTLLRTAAICEVLRLHARTPFSLVELRELFEDGSLSTRGLESLRQRHAACLRHWRLLLQIVEQIEAYNRHMPTGLLPTTNSLHLILVGKVISGELPAAEAPSLQDIQEALAFLGSTAVGILRRAPGSDDAYQLVMGLHTARRRLAAMASAATSPTAASVQLTANLAQQPKAK